MDVECQHRDSYLGYREFSEVRGCEVASPSRRLQQELR